MKLLTRIFFIILITPALSYAATPYGMNPNIQETTESDNTDYDSTRGSTFITEEERNIKTDNKSEVATTTQTEDAEKKKTEKKKTEKKETKKEEKVKKEGIFKKVGSTITGGVSAVRDKFSDIKDNSNENRIERNAKNAIEEIDKFCKKNTSAKNCAQDEVEKAKQHIDRAQKQSIEELNDPDATKVVSKFKTKLKNILTHYGFKQVADEVEKADDKVEETADEVEEDDDDVVEDTENNDTEPEKELTKEQQLAKVAELQENYDNMKEIENSFENRMLGATGMASMGMGGMQLASAISEDRADDAAEQQMKAYLATFSCTYANGKRFSGGETAIELPGGNELINLYSEYVGLANDLKTRKEALNLRPGIEAQPILDSATSGLYDDIATGKTTGAFTSLARALSDPNSADAAAWAAQREETAKQKKTALTTIGVGAVATVAGNLLINRNNEKERSAEILEKYEDLKKELDKTEQQISKQPTNTTQKKCTDFSLSGTYPECKCTKDTQKFNQDEGQCNEQQTPEPETETEKQSLELTTFDMADLFETGESVLTENAKNTLQQTNIKDFINETNTYCIEINGYSDNVGWKKCSDEKDRDTCNNNNNKELSERRAKAVATALGINASNENCKKIKIQGKGCTTEKCTRTVEIATCDTELNSTCTATN